ncbi:hypothetical protein SAMN04487901_106137 [Prevotella communis]|uniref:G domain-containing protein n=2 Tax=Prevotella communis TaxID=2913614 RepID=A0A1G7VU74_9BACT|nr:hypothetical protein SAMN04487901_106137 [Prevotella communis]
MRIIGLYGHANCGKSATLNMLKELLREAGKSVSSKPHPWSEEPETFEYKGIIVCVAPGGDTKTIVESNVRYFKSKNCDVAISATRTSGGSVEALQHIEQEKQTKIEWIRKSYEYNLSETTQTLCNQETARYLLGLFASV